MSFENIDRDTNESPPAKPGGGARLNPAFIAFLVLVVLAVIFFAQNRSEVKTHFLFFTKTSKVWTTIGVAILIGVGLDRLFTVWWRRRKQQ
jgi:hypothetical protein